MKFGQNEKKLSRQKKTQYKIQRKEDQEKKRKKMNNQEKIVMKETSVVSSSSSHHLSLSMWMRKKKHIIYSVKSNIKMKLAVSLQKQTSVEKGSKKNSFIVSVINHCSRRKQNKFYKKKRKRHIKPKQPKKSICFFLYCE